MSTAPHPKAVKMAFEREIITLAVTALVPLKSLRPNIKDSHKYRQLRASIGAIGIIEPLAVVADSSKPGVYFVLDGHARLEALRELGVDHVDCLLSTDDETYTYNKHVNRIAIIQEHRMIVRAVERGLSEERIAEAMALDVNTVRRRFRLLDHISEEAADLLKDKPCPLAVFDVLRRMASARQVEAAELMVGQNNYSVIFARAILVATPDHQLASRRGAKAPKDAVSEHHVRMEREFANLHAQVKMVEDSYGEDNLHLTVAKGYIAKLLANSRVVRWLATSRPEYLTEFQRIAEITSTAPEEAAAE